jgi:primosomal protein N' (replication factor Y)
VETAYYARCGRYQVFSLHNRYNQKSLPKVLIADMRQELRRGNDGALSALLRHELEENLSRGEQSILFLNRRGNARMLICGECGHVPECPRCSAPLTYHSANHRLMCHYCGFSQAVYETCPECGSRMKRLGLGTQKVEEELAAIFPGTRVLRMDTDTVSAAHSHEKLLSEFEKENIPILLGTQMVAKGLDFENVTLVGVLAADLSLYVNNYHAPERTFNLLAQVIGRAGRGSRQGRAVIQTFTPENDVIRAAAAQDYEAFYQSEIRMRKLRRYPPFADLFTFTVTGADEAQVIRAAAALRDGLREAVKQPGLCELEPEVLGPAGAPVVKVNNRYRYRVYLVGKNCSALRRLVAEFLHAFYRHRENRGLDVFADCNALQ